MAKITVEQLMSKMADIEADETELAQYFILDEDGRAFAPQFKLNPDTVQIPKGADADARSAAAMNGANWFARMNRRGKFFKKLRKGYDGPIIVSEGDSWFQYPLLLKDTIDWLMEDYAIMSLGAAGDLLQRMASKKEYLSAIKEYNAEILLLSGGGNDLVAGGALAMHLEDFDPALKPADYLLPSFQALLDGALEQYELMFTQVRQSFPHVSILCHGYDYPVPNKDKWLGKPMESRGIKDKSLQKAIAASMMDQFNRRLRRLAKAMPNVTYIDCREVVGDDRWHDGLHPTNEGYRDVAKKFQSEIKKLANTRNGPPSLVSGPFGHANTLAAAQKAPVIAGGGAKGYSLHLGLNLVDPKHYAGWDGALKACEADANAMEALAETQGFETKKLLTKAATRERVVKEIKAIAKKCEPGDMFLFTVSAHGGRIPDMNQDEDPQRDGDVLIDETLCLYDFQLADDELYMLWCEFKAGVRILMVPDTCHSGSMVRGGPSLPPSLFGRPVAPLDGPETRSMPENVGDRVWRENEAAYRNASSSYSAFKESVMTNPLSTPIRASVLNLGACKDEQFARDGKDHGAFTGALLKIWNDGHFEGNYHAFRKAIDAEIGRHDQTPQLFDDLVTNPNFVEDVPFSLNPVRKAKPVSPALISGSIASPEQGEGDEVDTISDADVDAIFERKTTGALTRSRSDARNWVHYSAFDEFIKGLDLQHFDTDEFLVLGGAHSTPGGRCEGKNTYPPQSLWDNIAKTAVAIDTFRKRIGKPIAITNAYRGPAYNACIGGATASQHMKFCALDFKVSGMAAPDVAMALRVLRDREHLFIGGIGRYNSFTHIDTRGINATWPKAFRDTPVPGNLSGV